MGQSISEIGELELWAVTAPGLEQLTRGELEDLGMEITGSEPGGVAFRTDSAGLARALLQLRTAVRLTLRMAEFPARTFPELERQAERIDWGRWVAVGAPVHLRVSARKSRLYHQDAVAERVFRSISAAVAGVSLIGPPSLAEQLDQEVQQLPGVLRVMVRIWRDRVTISVDAAGGLLHRRGWRKYSGKAPLRETLAAAMLRGAQWQGQVPLTDPFAGSGTLVIEAALLARGIAPGIDRHFAVELWPCFDLSLLEQARVKARAAQLPVDSLPLLGLDRDSGAVQGAWENAERAGVAADLSFQRASIASLPDDPGAGLLISNPPYGVRLGNPAPLRDLYATLGQRLRLGRPGWQLALLSADPRLTGQLQLSLREEWRTSNGGVAVKFLRTG